MAFLDIFKRKSKSEDIGPDLRPEWTGEGISFRVAPALSEATVEAFQSRVYDVAADEFVIAHHLLQMVEAGRARLNVDSVVIAWTDHYRLANSPDHDTLFANIGLPEEAAFQPVIDCHGTLSDTDFDPFVSEWERAGRVVRSSAQAGAIFVVDGQASLLPERAWALVEALNVFRHRPDTQRSQHDNELGWGTIRTLADAASALYASQYLATTHVVTPDKLRLLIDKDDTPFGRVQTVTPTFDGAPEGWIRAFDRLSKVQPHYDFTSGTQGRVRVVLSEPVRKVLGAIKRAMPGRRVAGVEAERLLHNPWAVLGDSAGEVIDEDDFVREKASLGALSTVFSVQSRMSDGRIESVELVVTEHFADGAARTSASVFESSLELAEFAASLEDALKLEREQFPWNEFDLTIDAEATQQFELAQHLLVLWRNQSDGRIDFEDIYLLDGYSERITGIGVAKPVYVPAMQSASQREDSDGWLPSELTPMISVTLAGQDGSVMIPLTTDWVKDFEEKVSLAQSEGRAEVTDAALPTAIETKQARQLVDSLTAMIDAGNKVKVEQGDTDRQTRKNKESLLVKTNFNEIDYQEQRRSLLSLPLDRVAVLPGTLRPGIELKKHQLHGVTWFQNLVSHSPADCRGALLADDMGLGKTLQLLTLLGWFYEAHPDGKPSLVVAPKSLLQNWSNEIERFFNPSYPPHLVLHGEALRHRKQPVALIDEQLQTRGITDLLRPDWIGVNKIVITTYEALTGYEFTFARQEFAFVICDEAQRIKTPGTRVTLAAKKLKANFRICCTGTPVENSLADLWCLFDFVQPGLLGALETFGKMYRRPIECQTHEQRAALDELQALIAPQTLRRTKEEIASELTRKHFVLQALNDAASTLSAAPLENERLEIRLSDHQHALYKNGLQKLQDAAAERDARRRATLSFGALHHMKAVCAEPYCLPGNKFVPDKRGLEAHLDNSPKMQWLLNELGRVERCAEKAIVFTELREVQTALSYFIHERFRIKPFVVNGDTQGRQGIIDRFSASRGFNVIILSTLAAGAGLNVTAANHVFHFTRAWNAAKENQATDRAYRIGQQKDVFVYCPTVVADFPTFELRLDQMLKRKGKLAGTTMSGSSMEQMLNGSPDDIKVSDLLRDVSDGEASHRRPQPVTLDDVVRLDGSAFEYFCRLLWEKQGYVASVTKKSGGDGGIDIVALRGNEGELLQCKSSLSAGIGWDAIKEVSAGAAGYQNAYKNTTFRRVCVTNQRFNTGAHEQARMNRVRLVEREQIEGLLAKHPVYADELDDQIIFGIGV
ncbi:helicase SNF2 [Caballeronia arvi]|uniref:Helicase SNF2 n=1 Tax=Caballeronia arvi TaxID=1777135 RepID=A0A158L0V0_9BURK|nr:SNF2-related protein [Caballeronia arvi]SAL86470.1 helicase SNF2 [Caballeronia arvi]